MSHVSLESCRISLIHFGLNQALVSFDLHCVSKKRHPFYFYDNFVRCWLIQLILDTIMLWYQHSEQVWWVNMHIFVANLPGYAATKIIEIG